MKGLKLRSFLPALQTLVRSNYEGADRVVVYGFLGGVTASAIGLGPIIGGWITTAYTWRLAFVLEVIIVLIVLLLSKSIKDAVVTGERPKLDLVGTALSAFGLGFCCSRHSISRRIWVVVGAKAFRYWKLRDLTTVWPFYRSHLHRYRHYYLDTFRLMGTPCDIEGRDSVSSYFNAEG
ncbi:MAG: MFS transporter [Methanotrichaceae archaeon]|nr:MFS transporter [Methanotrichaceae archaeon]